MKYISFEIENYRAITGPLTINVSKNSLIPIIGINECGKTTILQAIFAFDTANDILYDGRHLKDISNLYERKQTRPTLIRAKLQIKSTKIQEIYNDFLETLRAIAIDIETGALEEDDEYYLESLDDNLLEEYESFQPAIEGTTLTIERNLCAEQHFVYRILDFPFNSIFDEYFHHHFAKKILDGAPKIIYNDDFIDRPPSQVKLGSTSVTEWYRIYNQCYLECQGEGTLSSLLNNDDKRRVDSILAEMQSIINKKLSKAWKSFSLANHNSLEVRLTIQKKDSKEGQLDISIVEKVKDLEKHFFVSDRSKGFLWFFNFVMKLEFNPKIKGEKKHTIYLLDEPGSYLHFSAQEKLCNKLVEISKESGVVIYCTHSHTLLDPKKIPVHSIYIVEKDSKKRVSAKPLNQTSTKVEMSNAFQPLHEALELSAFDFKSKINTALCVEGIYDKYSIELFCDLPNVNVFPSAGGESIIKNIQYFIGFRINYIALWDNDDAGRGYYEKAKSFFGEVESKRFLLLPSESKKNVRMEEMFTRDYLESMKDILSLHKSSSYEKVIMNAYFSDVETKSRLINEMDGTTNESSPKN